MRGVTEWLESIGLSDYAQRFAENGVDLSVVRDLTDQDLKDLGVLLGHRRKILRAIAELDHATGPKPAKTATEPRRPDEAERRHLTVMFCDLVGSTALSARLDPEDMRTLIGAYHTCITDVIGRYQGKIARYMGDGVLVYFGYPQAHEDDAEQAVRAALSLIGAVASIRNVAAALQIRIGIATGTVVVTELLIEKTPAEQAVVGETPNLAARLQTMAEPGTVLISASTRRITGGEFHYRDLGPVALKGWAEPLRVYEVLGMSGVESRFEATHTTKLPPLFGRQEEIELLSHRWRQATREEGRLVTLTGEPGRSISLCEDSKAAAYIDLSAQDPRVHVRLYDGMALWMLGYPDRALQICAEARRYADASQHPFSEAIARTISLRVHQLRGDAAVVADQANAAIAFCERHEFVHYLAMALILHGWASAYQGEFEKGIAEIQEGLEKERATGALLFESYSLGLLADACIKNKRYGQALDFLKQAQLRLDRESSERFYAAEIYRLLGEAYLRLNQNLDQAEHYFCKGLQVAREQKAKCFELRVCLSMWDLCELRQNAGKCRSQLGEIYGCFTEGFDAPDLVRAKARLSNT